MDGARAEQIQQLESLLESYKSTNLRLRQQINEAGSREPASVAEERRQELEKERAACLEAREGFYYIRYPPTFPTDVPPTAALDAALSESKAQLEKIEELEQELFELSGEIAGGRHVPPGIRVLSFQDTPDLLLRDNPQTRQTEMDRVKEENAALIHRIEELQKGGARIDDGAGSGEHLIPKESWDAVCKERDELLGMVKQKETRLKRLKEVCCGSFLCALWSSSSSGFSVKGRGIQGIHCGPARR